MIIFEKKNFSTFLTMLTVLLWFMLSEPQGYSEPAVQYV